MMAPRPACGDSDLHLAGEFITNGSRVLLDVGHFEVSTRDDELP